MEENEEIKSIDELVEKYPDITIIEAMEKGFDYWKIIFG